MNAHSAGGTTPGLLWFPAAGMLAALIALRRRKLGYKLRPLLMLGVAALAFTSLIGCGSGAVFVTPVGNSVVTATATATAGTSSSNTTQTATLTIIITP